MRKKLCKSTESTCKIGRYYCIITLKINFLAGRKREKTKGPAKKEQAGGDAAVEKEKKSSKSRLLRIAVFLFVIYIAYSIVMQQLEIQQRKSALEDIQLQCQEQEEANQEMERLLAMSTDKDYIERIAREKLGYAYPDEKVYIDSSKN